MSSSTISARDLRGGGYDAFWRWRGRYRVVKGSRASKKSKTTALWFVIHMMAHPAANAVVVRKVYRTLKDSAFSDLRWAVHRLGVEQYWDCTVAPLELIYRPTGQKILFRGLDDPLKIASLSVPVGNLCWCWVEEAYELTSEEEFNMLDESIRGEVPNGLWKQLTLTFNPWNEQHWLKRRFFDSPNAEILAITTNYQQNEWLDSADALLFDTMHNNNPRRYQVAGLGNWGVSEGLVYENFTTSEPFEIDEIRQINGVKSVFGLDFGYTNDPTALFCGLLDENEKEIYVFDEHYQCGMSNERIFAAVAQKGYAKERIIADSAEPKSIDRLRDLGLRNIRAARKGADSVQSGIDFLQDFRIVIDPKCKNFIAEINSYVFSTDKFGKKTNKPEDKNNHLMDAMRYACEDLMKGRNFSW